MQDFAAIYPKIKDVSAVNHNRLISLYMSTVITRDVPGRIAECGVFRGGTAYLLMAATDKKAHFFDSFEGLPEPTDNDYPTDGRAFHANKGRFRGDYNKVRDYLYEFEGRFTLYKGWFCDTLGEAPDVKYSLVHLDVDHYQSYKECLEHFVPRIVSGGLLVCDDYKLKQLPGVKKAVDEYFGGVESLEHWHTNIQLTIRL